MRLPRIFIGAIVLSFLGGVVVGAQSTLKIGAEGEIQTIASILDTSATSTPHFFCSKYFRFSGVPKEKDKVGLLLFIFNFMTLENKEKVKNITMLEMGSDKLEIHVVVGHKVPTAKVLRSGGPVYPWLEVTISPEDFKEAPCLAHSKVIRR